MKNQKSGKSEVFFQLFILLVPCQLDTPRDLDIFSQDIAISQTSVEIVVDIFNKKMEPGNRMSKLKQPLIWF